MNKEQIEKFKSTVEEIYEIRAYSGRGMYGKECLGFVTENSLQAVAEICSASWFNDGDEFEFMLPDIFANARTDNMGYDTIIYFPNIEWVW